MFAVGALVALVSIILAPAPYNTIIASLYVVLYFINYIVCKNKKSGILTEKNTKLPLSFAIVKIFREGEDIPLGKEVADQFGYYYSLVPKGRYYVTVEKKNDDTTYTEIFKSEVMDVKKGIINLDFEL